MKSKTLFFCAAASFLALLVALPEGRAECCSTVHSFATPYPNLRLGRCADCVKPAWFYCAVGEGGCNLFGCNCEGGCRQPVEGRQCSLDCCDDRKDRLARDVDFTPFAPLLNGSYTGHDVVALGDRDKDGCLSETEVIVLLERMRVPVDSAAWRHLDGDLDNQLSAHEIDASLAQPQMKLVVAWP